jgi:hypothetical protein
MRRIGATAIATAMTLGGFAFLSGGTADAAKPQLSGTLSCKVSTTISITPSLYAALPAGTKDKKAKLNSTGTLSQCTGSEPTSGLAPPASGSTQTKSKASGRTCAAALGGTSSSTPSFTKAKLTFNSSPKPGKTKSLSTVSGGAAFDPVTQTAELFPTNPSQTQLINFIVAHADDRLQFTLSGQSLKKAYNGKTLQTKVVTTQTFTQLFIAGGCNSAAGLSTINVDPTYSTFKVL